MTEQMIFEWLQRKYGQSADARQRSMGLVYMTAETHDLAKELAKLFAAAPAQAEPVNVPLTREWFAGMFVDVQGMIDGAMAGQMPRVEHYGQSVIAMLEQGRAALKAAAPAQAEPSVPEGFKLVPMEPTEEMLDVLHDRIRIECIPERQEANIKNDREVWKAVLDAAPNRS